jgi:hypothetical protein
MVEQYFSYHFFKGFFYFLNNNLQEIHAILNIYQ